MTEFSCLFMNEPFIHGSSDNLTAIIVGHIETILSFPVPLMRPMHYLS